MRAQAIEHNIECIEIGNTIGSKALTVWLSDGSNFPGQQNFTRSFERYLHSMGEIYKALRMTGGCSLNTKCMSQPSIRQSFRIGARITL